MKYFTRLLIILTFFSSVPAFSQNLELGASFFGMTSPFRDEINKGYSSELYCDIIPGAVMNKFKFRLNAGLFLSDLQQSPETMSYGSFNTYRFDLFALYMPRELVHIGAGIGYRFIGHELDSKTTDQLEKSGMEVSETASATPAFSLNAGFKVPLGSAGFYLNMIYSYMEPEIETKIKDLHTEIESVKTINYPLNLYSVQLGIFVEL